MEQRLDKVGTRWSGEFVRKRRIPRESNDEEKKSTREEEEEREREISVKRGNGKRKRGEREREKERRARPTRTFVTRHQTRLPPVGDSTDRL